MCHKIVSGPSGFCLTALIFILLAHFIRAAHALIALAGMAVAVRADADRLQLAVVLLVVMAAGSHGAMNGLVVRHDIFPP